MSQFFASLVRPQWPAQTPDAATPDTEMDQQARGAAFRQIEFGIGVPGRLQCAFSDQLLAPAGTHGSGA